MSGREMDNRQVIANAMSVDLEDWFCVNNLNGVIRKDQWENCELRVEAPTRRLLDLFDKQGYYRSS